MANRFFVNGGVDNNWGTSGNWSATSGGAGGAGAPTSADAVFFDGSSPNCTINASGRVGLSVNFTGYTNTITFDQTLTITNNVTLAAGMTFGGASALIVTSTCTFTSNGKAVGVPLTFSHSTNITTTLADDLTMAALLTINPDAGSRSTFNGGTVNIGAGWSYGSGTTTTRFIQGTTVFVFTATGSWTVVSTGCTILVSVTFAAGGGTITLSAGTHAYGAGTLTYTSGTMVVTGVTLQFGAGTEGPTTLAVGGITWEACVLAGGTTTTTLSEDLNVSGDLTVSLNNTSTRTVNGNTIQVGGGLAVSGIGTNAKVLTGTTAIHLVGTGTWVQSTTSVQIRVPITIDTAGTITISGTVRYNTGTLSHVVGTIASTSAGTIQVNVGTATVFDFDGGDLGDVTLEIPTAGVILNLASELVIAAAGALVCLGTAASAVGIRSDSTPTQRALTITAGASIDVGYCNFTDIDNSGGATMHVFKGTISNSLNIEEFTPYDAPFGGSGGGGGEHSHVF